MLSEIYPCHCPSDQRRTRGRSSSEPGLVARHQRPCCADRGEPGAARALAVDRGLAPCVRACGRPVLFCEDVWFCHGL